MKIKEEEKISTSDIAAAGSEARLPARRADEPAVPADDRPHAVDEVPTPLFANEDAGGYRTRWSAIQTGFVDEPRKAVEEADTLVAEVMKRLAEVFAEERHQLESRWEHADQVSTEDLRLAMRRYRSFFERLLSL
jgi:hypothetical protein